ncbi:MAG: IgGFc-binding protein [Myxococcales bacterium]|nr:IgGFc-binding protein [Myxococcales bacterium]
MRRLFGLLWLVSVGSLLGAACSASDSSGGPGGNGGGGTGNTGGADGGVCDFCVGKSYTPCVDGKPGTPIACKDTCTSGVGCTLCAPGSTVCVGNEVHKCAADGLTQDELVEVCDVSGGKACSGGKCGTACELAASDPSNVGCEFWAVDLDQQDGGGLFGLPPNDPASAPWGVVLANAGQSQANVTIELNEAPQGQPVALKVVKQVSIAAGALEKVILPTRELDCGVKPNDYSSPGTCLSSQAFRITASYPIVVYQFNVFENAFSNDASLLLPSSALGKWHRIINWGAGHPVLIDFPIIGKIIDRSYVTVVGTKPGTVVKVRPSWRIKGNPPIAATQPGGEIVVNLGPFDVLNLETDDATLADDPKTMADLSGTVVESNLPVAVFSGVETTSAPGSVDIPKPSGWTDKDTCCLDHLEEQMFPVESVGMKYVIARSPVRSTGSFKEPDVIRFLGVAEAATVKTTLPAPYDSFTLQPGEVVTTWTQKDITVSADKPVMVGQILVSNQYVDGPYIGDPSLTVFPPVEQYRTEYVFLTPGSWGQNWVVITAEVTTKTIIDGSATDNCAKEAAGILDGVPYESRRCKLNEGVHYLTGDKPFGIVAYGYGAAGSYAFAGGANVKPIYDPPPIK